jgi:hypothetical protein
MQQQIDRAEVVNIGNPIAEKVTLVSADSPRAPSLQRAEARISEMAEDYCSALTVDLDEMERLLAGAGKAGGAEFRSDFHRLVDIVFNIKGQAGTFQYDLITRIAGDLYLLLQQEALEDADTVAFVRCHIAAMKVVVDWQMTGLGGDMGERLLSTLARMTPGAR